MWKTALILFLIMTSAIGSMLFWQWNAYSNQNDLSNGEALEQAHQQISVKTRGDLLQITQNIEGLSSKKEYRVHIPDSITDWKCVKSDGGDCDSKDENPFTFLSEDGSLSIAYNIQLNEAHSPFLLSEWTGHFSDISITNTYIEVIDSTKKGGTWVAGIPLKGFKKLDYIDYYVFEGKGNTPSLYWQPSSLLEKKVKTGMVLYLGEKNSNLPYSFEKAKKLPHLPHLTIVLTDQYPETNGVGLIVVNPDIKNETLERKIVYNYFLSKFQDIPLEEKWIFDVLTSLLLEQDSKVKKGAELIQELRRNFTDEELSQFLNLLMKEEIPLTFQKLDELVGAIKEKGTHFFIFNKNESTALVPLYYTDSRKVMVEGKTVKDIEAIYIKEDEFFPFLETMEALGFDVKAMPDQETLLLSKGNNSYRFYLNQNIFIYNEEDYGLLEKPLMTLNGKIYIKNEFIQSIFKVAINEDEEQINLSMILE